MPAAFDVHPGPHYAAFAAVKLAGYSAYAWWLGRLYRTPRNALGVGLVRTALGMGFGLLYGLAVSRLPSMLGDLGPLTAYAGLLPLRLVEWSLLVALFFDRRLAQREALWRALFWGVLVSYTLDLPAAFGFLLTGGLSIC